MKHVLVLLLSISVLCLPMEARRRWIPRVAAAAAITFTDNFTRADESPLTDAGAWTTQSITGFGNYLEIISNVVTSHGGNSVGFVSTPSYASNANQSATITITTAGLTGSGPMVRLDSSGNGYLLFIASAVSVQFYKITGGSASTLGASKTVTAMVAGNTLTLDISGTTLTGKINGSSISYTTTDATYSSGAPGLWISGPTSSASTFSCTSL